MTEEEKERMESSEKLLNQFLTVGVTKENVEAHFDRFTQPVDKVREAYDKWMTWFMSVDGREVEKCFLKFREIFGPLIQDGQHDIEYLAEKVHEAYLVTCEKLGWDVKEENKVPYSDLVESSKELDRASVRAVLDNINLIGGASGLQQAKREDQQDVYWFDGYRLYKKGNPVELIEKPMHLYKSTKELRNEIEGAE